MAAGRAARPHPENAGAGPDHCNRRSAVWNEAEYRRKIYTVEDRGTPYGHIDIYMERHADAEEFGVRYADVYQSEEI